MRVRVAYMVLGAAGAVALSSGEARAVPAFASQTGQPCTACHVGGFGPQLTPLGRAFKIGGYTQSGGDGLLAKIPLSAMVLSSFTNTAKNIPDDQRTRHYSNNNNFAVDQISAFVAGHIGDHTGAFIQITNSPIDNTWTLDNTDIRPYTTTFDVGDRELTVGFTVNNNPTVQDPYNTTFAWGYPYVGSSFAPTPAAAPMLAGGFAGNVVGASVYAWYDRSLYFEAGAYQTMHQGMMARFGQALSLGSSEGLMPYVRAAYEWNWGVNSAHVGAMVMQANVNPTAGTWTSDDSNGQDHYTDFLADASYSYLGDGTHIVTVQGTYVHERQNLTATTAAFNAGADTPAGSRYDLNEIRVNVSYWYKNTYGLTLGWDRLWGNTNPVLYAPAELTGSNNSSPNSNAFMLEADWVPFGKDDSWQAPLANLKLGLQYIAYTQFNGSSSNYDGSGRGAGANNTLYGFAWLAF